MGADRAPDGTVRQRGASGRTFAGLERRRQERDLDAQRFEQASEGAEVLLGQDLRRRHHRGLVARLDRGEHGERGHDRLAGTDVTLEQPVHRKGRGHILSDLIPDPLLRRGQRERQRAPQTLRERAGRLHGDSARSRHARAENREADL